MTMPLSSTPGAMQRLAQMLMQYAPKPATNTDGSRTGSFPGSSPALGGLPPPPPVPATEPSPAMPQAPMASAVSPEGMVNQNPPMPNPPLADAPPPVSSASFSPMGATGAPPAPPMLGAAPGTSPMGAMPGLPPSVEPSPAVGDETVRQAIEKAMRMGNNPAIRGIRSPWAQNFGNLTDQTG